MSPFYLAAAHVVGSRRDLSNNAITAIPEQLFANTPQLQYL